MWSRPFIVGKACGPTSQLTHPGSAQRDPKHEHFLGATKMAIKTKTKNNLSPMYSQSLSVLRFGSINLGENGLALGRA